MYYGEWEIINEIPETRLNISGKLLSFAPEIINRNGEEQQLPVPDLFVPDINYKNVVTEEPTDWGRHRDMRLYPVRDAIMAILIEYGTFCGYGLGATPDMPYITDLILQKMGDMRNMWFNKAWGAPAHMQTVLDLYHLIDKTK